MSWAGCLAALLQVMSSIGSFFARKRIVDETTNRIEKQNLEKALETISKAQKARDAAAAEFTSSNGVLDERDPDLRD